MITVEEGAEVMIAMWDRFLLIAFAVTVWGGIAWSFYGMPSPDPFDGDMTTDLPTAFFGGALACFLLCGAIFLFVYILVVMLS
jgi:hypothetical protein